MCKNCEEVSTENPYWIFYRPRDDYEDSTIGYNKEGHCHSLSMGELGHHSCIIKYCPWCGRKLEKEKTCRRR